MIIKEPRHWFRKVDKGELGIVFIVLISAFILRVVLSPLDSQSTSLSQPGDMYVHKLWSYTAVNSGVESVYDLQPSWKWCVYPPVIPVILSAVGWLYKTVFSASLTITPFDSWLQSVTLTVLIKMPVIIADIITSLLIFFVVRKRLNFKTAFLATAFYAFNPAILYNSAIWGAPYDSLVTLLMFLGIVTLNSGKMALSWLFTCLAILTNLKVSSSFR